MRDLTCGDQESCLWCFDWYKQELKLKKSVTKDSVHVFPALFQDGVVF